jgi:hypothetical protein
MKVWLMDSAFQITQSAWPKYNASINIVVAAKKNQHTLAGVFHQLDPFSSMTKAPASMFLAGCYCRARVGV